MVKISIECCEGKPTNQKQCLKDRCPHYRKAAGEVYESWLWVPTGFGNLYGYPQEADNLSQVRKDLGNVGAASEYNGLES